MKYRIIKETDGFGVERIYAQVGYAPLLGLFGTAWYYLNSFKPETFKQGEHVWKSYKPEYNDSKICTEELSYGLIETYKMQIITEAKRNATPKQEIVRDII